jgi:hypothetical protein
MPPSADRSIERPYQAESVQKPDNEYDDDNDVQMLFTVACIKRIGDVRFFVGEGGSPPPSLGHAVCVFTFGDAN